MPQPLTCAPCNQPHISCKPYLLWLARILHTEVPSTKVHHFPSRPPDVYGVSNTQRIEILGHFTTLRKLGVDVGKVDLREREYESGESLV